ncbi:MAG: alpha-L-fucosidase, partial [Draconibacterium sp.]|nr:alpha-L-fucosidase [Draconibacterium sp.]
MKLKVTILILFISIVFIQCSEKGPVNPPEPFLPIPNEAQHNWHKAEYIMFVHFGMKTFYPSNDHMGYGKEDPQKFNPVKFDASQWVYAAKAGGFKGIVLTTKHHDGFCNWQSDLSPHNVKSSPWKDGKGDIIKELAEACRAGGLYFGIYVSLIDKYYEQAHNGDYSEYDEYYYNQLKELSTNYGTIDEYWFDGYKADNLKINYKRIAELIKREQPNAVVYDSGTMVEFLPDRSIAWPGAHGGTKPDQNYRVLINDTLRWYPNEPSIILQGNWFHNNTPVVSL